MDFRAKWPFHAYYYPNIVHKFSKGCIPRHRHPCEDPHKDVCVSGKSARIHVKILASPVSVLWNVALMPQPWVKPDVISAPSARVRTVHEKTDRTQYPSFHPQFWPNQGPIQNSLDYQGTHAESVGTVCGTSECVTWYLTALQSPAPGDRPTVRPHWLCYTRRRLWSRSVMAISCYGTTNWLPFTWDTVRPGRSTPADLVQSRSSQTGPRSVSELESVLTLPSA